MAFPSHIFKAYDIRGLVDGELNADLAYAIGRSFAQFLKEQKIDMSGGAVVVGYDMRPTSQPFRDAVVRGLAAEGVAVVDIGLVSTPLFNFACIHYPDHVGGIMVTASHNPAAYNGFKMTMHSGLPIGKESGMDRIRDLAQTIMSEPIAQGDVPAVTKKDVIGDYLEKIFSIIPEEKITARKIVVDYGNGMGSVTLKHLLAQLPVEVVPLYETPDGTFPNHEANPLKVETLRDLQQKVIETKADFGFALDGDADRIGLVDEKGRVVDASFVGALIGREVATQAPGGLMLYDLRSSQIAPETWKKLGMKTEMCRVGHALIKKQMKETGAVFASELSLHLYFHDLGDIESGDLCLMYLLRLLTDTGKTVSELAAPLAVYVHSGEINFEVEKKDEAIAAIEAAYAGEAVETSHLDGLWMKLPWGWFNVRKSNTEPVLRLNLETATRAETEKRVGEIERIINPSTR